MKTEDAKRILAAAVAKSREMDRNVSIAVVDAAGLLVVFERGNGAGPFTSAVAEGKAATAAFTGRETVLLTPLATERPHLAAPLQARLGARWIPAEGGIPIRDADGGVIGAVGVSGGAPEEDALIARTGIEAL